MFFINLSLTFISKEKSIYIPGIMNYCLQKDIFQKFPMCMQVAWGKISMVEAEKRLLVNALQDTDNQHFVLLSDRWLLGATCCFFFSTEWWCSISQHFICSIFVCSCVPLHNFDYVYNYLTGTNISFIDWYSHLHHMKSKYVSRWIFYAGLLLCIFQLQTSI